MTINYPIAKKINENKIDKKYSAANRGMDLENIINLSNEYYLANDIAVIYKKPTPVQIVHVDYPSRNKAVITEAYYKTPSTTDYNGIYLGKYIDFEAKENKNKTSFPLSNVHPHQVNHLENIKNHGGIGFLIIYWNHYNEFYLYPIDKFLPHYKEYLGNGRKSIPYSIFLSEAYVIKEGYQPRLDYLKVVKDYLL
ncbi:MAG: Holliday junction resolvase RecU [Anaeroplasmataceae bacterium]